MWDQVRRFRMSRTVVLGTLNSSLSWVGVFPNTLCKDRKVPTRSSLSEDPEGLRVIGFVIVRPV